jgi:DNA-binding PadR family transcriptional regulator
MEKRYWLLLVIGDTIQPIQIQKTMFKFAMESGASESEIYDFAPYNWGPCSFDIYDDLSTLRAAGHVETARSGRGWNSYKLTEAGRTRVEQLRKNSDDGHLRYLDETRDWVLSRKFEDLLRDVYKDYPDYATQSMIPS